MLRRLSPLWLALLLSFSPLLGCATSEERESSAPPSTDVAQAPAPAPDTPGPSGPASPGPMSAGPTPPSASPERAAPRAGGATQLASNEVVGVKSAKLLAPEMAKVVWLAREDSKVMDHITALTETIGPRLTGSSRATKACAWARDQFAAFGLDARVEEWGTFPVGFDRGPWSGRMLEPEAKPLVFCTNAWSPGTSGPTAGLAMKYPTSVEDVESKASAYHGAWVLLPSGAGAASQPSGEERQKIDAALDAVGIAGRIRGGRGELVLTGGNYRISAEKLPTRVQINLRGDQLKEIQDLVAAGKEVKLEFDVQNTFIPGPVPCSNVIAEIKGTDLADEIVIIGGHLDSWDGATGATDNGTGVATTLEVARLLAKSGVQPRRTIRFMLWTGEEQGLLGSRAYVEKHKDEMPKISAVIVHDEGTNYVAGLNATKAQKEILEPLLAPLGELDPEMPFRIKEVNALPRPGSDHESFLDAGVPGFFWIQEGRSNYNHGHHTQYDTLDAVIPEYQKHSAMVIACAALGVANLDQKLPREGINAPRGVARGGRRFLGVSTDEAMKVTQVMEDTPAAKAGVKEGDQIVKIGDAAIAERADIGNAVRSAGTKTTVTVKRDGKDVVLLVELPARPESAPAAGGDAPAASRPAGP